MGGRIPKRDAKMVRISGPKDVGDSDAVAAWVGNAWAATRSKVWEAPTTAWNVTHLRTGFFLRCTNDRNEPWTTRARAVRLAKALDAEIGELWPRSRFGRAPRRPDATVLEKLTAIRTRETA